ncbi:MAG: hypothetical protein HYU64_15660 [Armatimonadetes bacterium]|nr:hypothetical protein [Armatimonadota bacterium]
MINAEIVLHKWRIPVRFLILAALCFLFFAGGLLLLFLASRGGAPHPAKWMLGHAGLDRRFVDSSKCWKCHRQEASCVSCHKGVPLVFHGMKADWRTAHGSEAGQKGYCITCHNRRFCVQCHKKEFKHPVKFLEKGHPPYARKVGDRTCEICHKKSYCLDCHATKKVRDLRHPRNWLTSHPRDSKARSGQCEPCHRSSHCYNCHVKKKPSTHLTSWTQAHGPRYLNKQNDCQLCHDENQCQGCHKTRKPASHLFSWKTNHGKVSLETGGNKCRQCHLQKTCDNCHKSPMPHPPVFRTRHGGPALTDSTGCNQCHESRRTCMGCHKVPMPHPREWMGEHGQVKLIREGACFRCHRKGKDCEACHRLPMPHPKGWGKVSHKNAKDFTTCSLCHQRSEDCITCHRKQKVVPGSHKLEKWKVRFHKLRTGVPAEDESCKLCHGRNACVDCHKTALPHAVAWINEGHKKEPGASFQQEAFCFRCHQDPKMCKICHKGKFKWKLGPDGKPVPTGTPAPGPSPAPAPTTQEAPKEGTSNPGSDSPFAAK